MLMKSLYSDSFSAVIPVSKTCVWTSSCEAFKPRPVMILLRWRCQERLALRSPSRAFSKDKKRGLPVLKTEAVWQFHNRGLKHVRKKKSCADVQTPNFPVGFKV